MVAGSPVLLDTHAWLWILQGQEKLSPAALTLVAAASQVQQVYIAAISLWEVSMLVKKGRVMLDEPVGLWLETALKAPGTSVMPLTSDIAIESCELPGVFHGDPADRMIVATARVNNCILVTRDQKLLDYAKFNYVHAERI